MSNDFFSSLPVANVITMDDNGSLNIKAVSSMQGVYGSNHLDDAATSIVEPDVRRTQPTPVAPSEDREVTIEEINKFKQQSTLDNQKCMVYINLGVNEGYRREVYNFAGVSGTPDNPCVILAFKDTNSGYFPPIRDAESGEYLYVKLSGDENTYPVLSMDLVIGFMGYTIIILPIVQQQ